MIDLLFKNLQIHLVQKNNLRLFFIFVVVNSW